MGNTEGDRIYMTMPSRICDLSAVSERRAVARWDHAEGGKIPAVFTNFSN